MHTVHRDATNGTSTGAEARPGEPTTTDVLIVGAGPTGLALGCDLARRGVRSRVIERADTLFPGSRGKGLQPRTMEVLDDLGVIDAVLTAGGPAPVGMVWRDGAPQHEHRVFDPVDPTPSEPYTGLQLPQWRTQEILLARLRECGGQVEFGAELVGLTQDADEVRATLGDGRLVRARYAVAADGGRSTVRRTLGIGMTGRTVDPEPLLVADVRLRDGALGREHWHIFPPAVESDGFLTLCPLPRVPDFQLVAQFPGAAVPDISPEGVRDLVAARTHLTRTDVTEVRWASDFRARAALADRFRAGRVFLAGDAAHVHSPAGGQGLNTSIQDAYNLGWKLAAVLRGGAPETLLDSYEEERLPIAAGMLELTTRVHRGETRRGASTSQLHLGYRDSSLSAETRTGLPEGALRAGDRAPDGRPGGVRLFDAFRGPHWTLLAVGTDAALPELTATGAAGDGTTVRTLRVPAYEPYGTGVFLVRPDGYVSWAGATAEGLAAHLDRFGLRCGARPRGGEGQPGFRSRPRARTRPTRPGAHC